jgi:hypothetical protein
VQDVPVGDDADHPAARVDHDGAVQPGRDDGIEDGRQVRGSVDDRDIRPHHLPRGPRTARHGRLVRLARERLRHGAQHVGPGQDPHEPARGIDDGQALQPPAHHEPRGGGERLALVDRDDVTRHHRAHGRARYRRQQGVTVARLHAADELDAGRHAAPREIAVRHDPCQPSVGLDDRKRPDERPTSSSTAPRSVVSGVTVTGAVMTSGTGRSKRSCSSRRRRYATIPTSSTVTTPLPMSSRSPGSSRSTRSGASVHREDQRQVQREPQDRRAVDPAVRAEPGDAPDLGRASLTLPGQVLGDGQVDGPVSDPVGFAEVGLDADAAAVALLHD